MSDFDTIVDELYSGAPADFVSTRDARAKGAADAQTAASIRALRKPTTAAWVVNVFARERAAQLQEALRLAAELRDAQADLDAAALAQLGRERRALTARLAADAAELARARGGRVTDATREAVQQTLSAAFFDPGAAAAVASGRLVTELDVGDGESLDPSTVVAGAPPEAPELAPAPADEVAAMRERRRAQHALQEAERALATAQRDHTAAERDAREAARRTEQIAARIAELESQLTAARTAADEARAVQAAAEERRQATEKALADRREAVAAARQPGATG
ncbi:transposase [Microbacterium sp. 8M]|uniref:transposase n=1 Tax=Microbacterium sp. 8M TaxID=2653153 RepID=UPI00135A4910|nr:transposase [Microbacterium sp. 8M]